MKKNLVSKRVIDVPGVKMVFNNMTIERIAPMSNCDSRLAADSAGI